MEIIYRLWPYWTEPSQIQRVTNAFVIALYQHSVAAKVKTRKYCDVPYIAHPVRLALRVSSHPLCQLSWVGAALVHDVIEDTVYTPEEEMALKHRIVTECGEEELNLVLELTNENHDKSIPRRQRKEKDRQRLSKASNPAKIIKMLDRIDNLQEMTAAPVKFKKLYVGESVELLKVIGDADNDIAGQLKSTIDYVYSWRIFSKEELQQKPVGTVFEHTKFGKCWIESGRLHFHDENWKDYIDIVDIMRETGE